MGRRYRRPRTAAERAKAAEAAQDKLAQLHQDLADQVARLRSGEEWKAYLDVASRFHDYSFNNLVLIYAQRPDATLVAGYGAWQAMGRQVEKGERGIRIIAPVMRRPRGEGPEDVVSAPETGSVEVEAGRPVLAGYRVAYVWDVSQTSGAELPTQPMPALLQGQAPEGLWEALAEVVTERGFDLERAQLEMGNGWTDYGSRQVRVRSDVDDAQAVKTLAHEAAHVLLHGPGDFGGANTRVCRGRQEVEAESVAYLIAASHGLDTASYSFPYVTGWASTVDLAAPEAAVRATGERVLSTAREVLGRAPGQLEDPAAGPELGERVLAGTEAAVAVHHRAAAPAAADQERREELVRMHEEAESFFASQASRSWVPAYLEERGLAGAGASVGAAPDSWTALTQHLRALGYEDELVVEAGLGFRARTGNVVDRFRDRAMVAVRNDDGQVVGFIGRARPGAGERVPAYLNSPTTPIYRKGDHLYGLAEARAALEAGARPVIVEGAFDALAVTAAGGGELVGVASSGTALTKAEVDGLAAVADLRRQGVVVAMDADASGRAAAERALGLLSGVGADPLVADLPAGSDPAQVFAEQGPAELRSALSERARPLVDQVVEDRLRPWADRLDSPEGRRAALDAVLPLIAELPGGQSRRQLARLAERCGVDHSVVVDAMAEHLAAASMGEARRAAHDRRDDLDRGQFVALSPAAAAQADYPRGPSPRRAAGGENGKSTPSPPKPAASRLATRR